MTVDGVINNFCVYKHVFPNGKVYIGMTGVSPQKRWRNGNGYKSQALVYRAIEKYGWDNIVHEIVSCKLRKEDAEKLEVELIKNHKSTDAKYGYNNAVGGSINSGYKWNSDSGRLRMREVAKSRIISETTREKHRESYHNRVKYLLNSTEAREKQRISITGYKHTEESKAKMSEAHKGKVMSQEQKRELSNRMMGNKIMCGRHLSEETKEKLRHINTKTVLQYTKNGNYVNQYCSTQEAKAKTGASHIAECCNGKRKSAGGYLWKYKEEYE